jgi:4-amino-4-deoxy-L-arabinose transferase-like glycosyltransferase
LSRAKTLFVILAITFVAFALRVHRLNDKNIWWDEGISACLAPQGLATITRYQARDQHPPLFYWALHSWNSLTGHATFSLRFLSVMSGTLCIPLAYLLGRFLAERQVGLLAGLFLAMARFHIQWSQEIKMYAMGSFLSMASTSLVVLILRQAGVLYSASSGPSEGDRSSPASRTIQTMPFLWAAYVIVTALAVYTHYLALLIVVSQNLFIAIVIVAKVRTRELRRSLLIQWFLSQLGLAILFAPWFFLHHRYSVSWSPRPILPFSFVLRLVATLFSLGISIHLERYTWLVLVLWLPLLVGLVPLLRLKEQRWGALLLWVCLIVPPMLIYLLSLPRQGLLYEAKTAPRFFLVSLLPYSILLAWSLVLLGRRFVWAGLLGVALVFVSSTISLGDHYTARYLRDDYPTLVRVIQAYAQPNDAILLDTDMEWPIFQYYYSGSLPQHYIPANERMTTEKAHRRLEPIWAQHDGLWVVFTSDTLVRDPGHLIENWLKQHGQMVFDQSFDGRRLVLYARSPRPLTVADGDGLAIQHPLVAQVDEGVSLVGYDQALREFRTGDTLRLVTYWRVERVGPLALGLWVEAMLLDIEGMPVTRATGSWGGDKVWLIENEGEILRAQHDFPISSAVPGGKYDVCLAISRNSVNSSQIQKCVSTVHVVRTAVSPSSEAGAIQHPSSENLGSTVRFLGYDLTAETCRPGESVKVTLYWQALRKMDISYVVFVHLLGGEFNPATENFLWGQVDRVPVGGTYPTTAWVVGETIADPYDVPIQPDTPPGVYQIEIGLYQPITGQRLAVLDEEGRRIEDRILLQGIEVSR